MAYWEDESHKSSHLSRLRLRCLLSRHQCTSWWLHTFKPI